METIIKSSSITTYSTNTITKSKTNKYKNEAGKVLYTLSVTGTFKYTGSTATCTNSTAKATSLSNDWKIISKNASKSGNKATAKAIVNHHYNGSIIQTKYPSVTLTCSATGKLS